MLTVLLDLFPVNLLLLVDSIDFAKHNFKGGGSDWLFYEDRAHGAKLSNSSVGSEKNSISQPNPVNNLGRYFCNATITNWTLETFEHTREAFFVENIAEKVPAESIRDIFNV